MGAGPDSPRPHWIGTLLYVPLLYGLGWLSARPFGLLFPSWRPDQLDLAGAAIALVLLLATLPWRLRRAWDSPTPWRSLGVVVAPAAGVRAFGRGLLKAVLLLVGVSGVLVATGQARWGGTLTAAEGLNALALLLGWVSPRSCCSAAGSGGNWNSWPVGAGPSACRRRSLPWYTPGPGCPGRRPGPAWRSGAAGIGPGAAAPRRWRCAVGAVGLHGGLVGGWFALLAGPLQIAPGTPAWLVGAGSTSPNPIGGLLGWLGLGALLWVRRRWWSPGAGPAGRALDAQP